MPETELPPLLWGLLGTNLFFLLLVWIGQIGAKNRLKRIEIQLANRKESSSRPISGEHDKKADEHEQYLIFQEFLDEDPTRSELPKKEQFAAYRKWRKEKGLNWSA
jgi:hypothetical protein